MIGGICPAVLVGVALMVWYGWFKGRTGSAIMLIGLIAPVKGAGELLARTFIGLVLHHK